MRELSKSEKKRNHLNQPAPGPFEILYYFAVFNDCRLVLPRRDRSGDTRNFRVSIFYIIFISRRFAFFFRPSRRTGTEGENVFFIYVERLKL